MAGAFYLMGLDYDRALMGTLLYRRVSYFLPILISLLFYRHFFMAQKVHKPAHAGSAGSLMHGAEYGLQAEKATKRWAARTSSPGADLPGKTVP